MKSIAHAWVGLMALERLKDASQKPPKDSFVAKNFKGFHLGGTFGKGYNEQAARFVKFFDKHKDAFVQGAWFPDSVISDNLTGGHTFKLKRPATAAEKDEGELITNEPPAHLSSASFITGLAAKRKEKVFRVSGYTLPDRCEALGHALRDMELIKHAVDKGSDVMFNDDMISLYFLMLSHYLADAHVPPHSDARDFYTPSKVHPDMEGYWDDEIKKLYSYDARRHVFDYGLGGEPELKAGGDKKLSGSFLSDVLTVLSKRSWDPSGTKVLGNNEKIYDYIKAVCHTSYLMSWEFIPELTQSQYNKLKITEDPAYSARLRELSVHVMADAIDSVALVWLRTWDRYAKHEMEVKQKAAAIKKKGGAVIKS